MKKILFVGRFYPYSWKEIPTEFFIAEGLERNNWQVIRIDIDKLFNHDVANQIVTCSKNVDMVLFASGILKLSLEDFGWICNQVTTPKILYTNDWIFLDKEREKSYLERFPFVDLLITSDYVDYSKYEIKQIRISMACLPSHKFAPCPCWNLVFVGAVHYSKERKEFLDRIKDCFPNTLDIYGNCGTKDPIYGKELEEILQEYKIVLGHNCVSSKGYWSSRNYIIPGYGGFLLTPYVEGLEEEFENKKYLVWFKDFEECTELIKYYLEHDKEREQIRRQGYEYTQKVHNWDSRIKEFIKVFKGLR